MIYLLVYFVHMFCIIFFRVSIINLNCLVLIRPKLVGIFVRKW